MFYFREKEIKRIETFYRSDESKAMAEERLARRN